MGKKLNLTVGVKTDPIEYRYSYDWLFGLMAEEGVYQAQLGTFPEIYDMPDDFLRDIRTTAENHGVTISSSFLSRRELGGFVRNDSRWEAVSRKKFERLIDIAAVVGARSTGSCPGAVFRDQMETKQAGIECYMRHMKELMSYAYDKGLEALTIEPMSCLAEPPTLPDELVSMAEEFNEYHKTHSSTVPVRYCTDVAHGYADSQGRVVHGNMELLEVTLPYLQEIHLKNTDEIFNATFGFTEEELDRGIVDIPAVRGLLLANAERIPVDEVVGYFETSGPKFGRDYSDWKLEDQLRLSLRYLVRTFTVTDEMEERS